MRCMVFGLLVQLTNKEKQQTMNFPIAARLIVVVFGVFFLAISGKFTNSNAKMRARILLLLKTWPQFH